MKTFKRKSSKTYKRRINKRSKTYKKRFNKNNKKLHLRNYTLKNRKNKGGNPVEKGRPEDSNLNLSVKKKPVTKNPFNMWDTTGNVSKFISRIKNKNRSIYANYENSINNSNSPEQPNKLNSLVEENVKTINNFKDTPPPPLPPYQDQYSNQGKVLDKTLDPNDLPPIPKTSR